MLRWEQQPLYMEKFLRLNFSVATGDNNHVRGEGRLAQLPCCSIRGKKISDLWFVVYSLKNHKLQTINSTNFHPPDLLQLKQCFGYPVFGNTDFHGAEKL